MSVIIRLQNLPWSANAHDIRMFFQGLSIPEGGVHIVGGELGDAFIAFSTDEDARQAMMLSGGKLKEVKVQLFLSSRNEMQKVIEQARSMSFPVAQPVQLQPAPAQLLPAPVPQPQSQLKKNDREEDDERDSRKRSRSSSRSRDRKSNRRDSRDTRDSSSRRRRSRSRDRRRRKSRSRSPRDRSNRDRYGRDVEKRDDMKSTSKDKNRDNKYDDKKSSIGSGLPGKQLPPVNNSAQSAAKESSNFPASQLPFGDDPLSIAMRNTLSSLNLPFNLPKVDNPPMLGGDARKTQSPPKERFNDHRNGQEQVPMLAGFGDLNPLLTNANLNGLSGLPFGLNPNAGASQVWLNQAPPAVIPNFPMGFGGFNVNLLDNLRRAEMPNNDMRPPNLDRLQDNDTRVGDNPFGLRADVTRIDDRKVPSLFPDQSRFDPFASNAMPRPDAQADDRFDKRNDRHSRFSDNDKNSRDYDRSRSNRGGDHDRRNDFGSRGDPRGHREDAESNLFVELLGLGFVSYREVRYALADIKCRVEELRFKNLPDGKRAAVKFTDKESKALALKESGRLRIGGLEIEVVSISNSEYFSFREDAFRERFNRDEGEKLKARLDPRNDRSDARGPRDTSDDSRRDEENLKKDTESNEALFDAECAHVANLPPNITDRDLCDFFSDVGLTPKKLHIMLDDNGEPLGDAYVEFWSHQEAKLSCSKHRAPLGRYNVDVKLVSRREMQRAVGGGDNASNDFQGPLDKRMGSAPPLLPEGMGHAGPVMPHFPGNPMMFPGPMPGPRPFMNNYRPRFRGERPMMPPGPSHPSGPPQGDPDCTVTMDNIPYRASINDILEFFPPEFGVTPMSIFRKLNQYGQPTGMARIVMKSPEMALEALKTLDNIPIGGRPVQLGILGKGNPYEFIAEMS